MHELSICQALMTQVEQVVRQKGAARVISITLQVGPLSGVEGRLLSDAFVFAAAGTPASAAQLVIESMPVRIWCTVCERETDALPNRLVCGHCGAFRTRLVSGDELLLKSLELELDAPGGADPRPG